MSDPLKPTEPLNELYDGLKKVLESVKDLTVEGADQLRRGVFPKGTGLNGVYGFTFKTDFSKPSIRVEPFGNLKSEGAGPPTVSDVIEPRVDIDLDSNPLVITAEVPGVTADDIQVAVLGTDLVIVAERGKRRYRKEMPLPSGATAEGLSFACHEGLLEVKLYRVTV